MSKQTRRQFLKQSAIVLAGAALAPGLTSVFAAGPSKKVLILGAGMSGLVAGYELSQLGHDVTILEARTRPGGRVHTLREPFSDGLYAEEGAARIPDNHDITLKYVKLLDVPLEPMYPPQLKALRLDGGRREVPSEGFTEGLAQLLGREMGGSPGRWSKIKGGTDLLPKAFADRLGKKIHYGVRVVRLEQDANSARAVFLDAGSGGSQHSLSADRILCTIPFSVLRDIELPASFSERKRNTIKTLRYDSVSRVYLQSKNRFWEAQGLSGFALTGEPVEIWQPTWSQPGTRGILMTYNRPGQAERVSNMKESERISSTLNQLDKIFPGLRGNYERGATKCWIEDEFARGAWAFVGMRDMISAAAPEGRIHFAGEHLSLMSSWMQGALSSGLRAVKEINEAA
jgi:monoamine oxidase